MNERMTALLGLGLLAQTASMVTPGDGGEVERTSSPVRFSGYYNYPKAEVTIRRTATSPAASFHGAEDRRSVLHGTLIAA